MRAEPRPTRVSPDILCLARTGPIAFLALVTGLATARVAAQLPAARLAVVSPQGGKQGTTFEVTVSGADLDEADSLHFSQPGITATLKTNPPGAFDPGPQPVHGRFVVTIAADAPVGACDIRAAGRFGISTPRAFVVGHLDEAAEVEPNNAPANATPAKLETVVSGAIGGGTDIDCFRVAVKAGQRVIVDCLADRIDSRLDGTLVLLDAAGQELERSRDASRRDPELDFTAAADGEYVIKLHDAVYGGSAEHFYRLSFSAGPRVDYVLPPAGAAGKGSFVLHGRNLPGGQPVPGVDIGGRPLQSLAVEIEVPGDAAAKTLAAPAGLIEPPGALLDGFTYRHPAIPQAIFIGFATAPPVAEAEPNNDPAAAQKVAAPCEVAGQLFPQGDQDWTRFDVKAGDVFWIEVLAHRLGSAVDPFLLIQQVTKNDKGEETAQDLQATDDAGGNVGGNAFDTTTDDAVFRYAAPADGACRILVKDLGGATRADPRNVYRLSIRREAPDFRLTAVPRFQGANADPNQNPPQAWTPFLRRGGTELIEVLALRRDGFGGEIRLAVEGLPPGVTCPGAVIGAGANGASLTLAAAADAAAWAGTIRISGTASIGGADATRLARTGSIVWPAPDNQGTARARVTQDIALAVSGVESAPFIVEAGKGAELEMCKAGTLSIPITVTRRGDFKGAVAFAAVGLPPNVQPKPLSLDANTVAGKLELTIAEGAPLGTFTFNLHVTTQVAYSRNPEAAARAAARKTEIDKVAGEAAAAAKAAGEAKAANDKVAGAAAEAQKKAVDAQGKAQNEIKAVADEVKAAADEVKRLVDGIKAAADKTAADAEGRAKAATETQAALAKLATDTANASKPKDTGVGFGGASVTIKITPAPITVAAGPASGPIKPGAKATIPVTVTRLYGYNEAVQVTVAVPKGVAGLNAPAITIAQGQTQGSLIIEAADGATAGQHNLTIQAAAKLNNVNLSATAAVPLTVEKP